MKSLCFLAILALLQVVSGLYSAGDAVVILTPSNFKKEVLDSDSVVLVEFFAPWCGHCKALTPEWIKAAKALKGIVKVAAVDMDANPSVGQPYQIQGFPTIKIFGADKNKPEDYQGARQAKAIVDVALQHAQRLANQRLSGKSGSSGSNNARAEPGGGKHVVTLTAANFEEKVLKSQDLYMVEFYAPWCGHCKNLAPEYASAAKKLKDQKVHLGAVDCTVEQSLCQQYGIQGYPTLKVFAAGSKGEPVDYQGGRTSGDIAAYLEDELAKNQAPPEVYEVTNQELFENECASKKICFVSVLPHILDTGAAGRNAYLATLRSLADKFKRKPFSYVWTEAGKYTALEEALGLGGFGYPAMAAVSAKKDKFVVLKGAFTEAAISDFIGRLLKGKEATTPLGQLPALAATEAWDGKDGVLPTEDDAHDEL
eukprot:Colp12_sorted_trinity150504_noHs@29888